MGVILREPSTIRDRDITALVCKHFPARQVSSVLVARAAMATRVLLKAPLRKGCLYAFPSHPLMVAVVQVATLGTTALALNAITVLLGPIVLATISVIFALPGPPTAKRYGKRLVSRTRLPCTVTVAEMASTNAARPQHTVSGAKAVVTSAPLAPIVQTPLGAMRMSARSERHPKRVLLFAVKTDVILTVKHL